MNAALWTKLKAAGPVRSVPEELERFRFWLPVSWQPLNTLIISAVAEFQTLASANKRWDFEDDVLNRTRQYLGLHGNIFCVDLLRDFVEEVKSCIERSKQLRLRALNGERVEHDAEEEMVRGLRQWLRMRKKPECRALLAWLERMLEAWWQARVLHEGGPIQRAGDG